jgi:hypothetical protein
MEETLSSPPSNWNLAALWIGILSGPVAWALDEVVGYTATSHECSTGHMLLLHALTGGSLAACALGFICAWIAQQNKSASSQSGPGERRSFMAHAGMILSVGFALVIIATAIPKWMLTPCD